MTVDGDVGFFGFTQYKQIVEGPFARLSDCALPGGSGGPVAEVLFQNFRNQPSVLL
jgi:hypothetical protein